MYLWMKLLHILAVVMFIGNITTGIIAAIQGGFPLLRTGWIAWTLVLFTLSGLLFMFRVAPLQRQLRTLAEAGAASGSFDYEAYHRVALRWELWGAGATITPVPALALMVFETRAVTTRPPGVRRPRKRARKFRRRELRGRRTQRGRAKSGYRDSSRQISVWLLAGIG